MATQSVNKKAIVGVFGFIMMLACIPFAGRALFGGGAGEKCGKQFACKLEHVCVSNTCQRQCKADDDCGSGWGCRPLAIQVTTYKGKSLSGISNQSMKVCFSPDAMERISRESRSGSATRSAARCTFA